MTDTMLSTRTLPWMILGTQIDEPMSPTEAIHAAGLDWNVSKEPLFTKFGGEMLEVEDRFAMVRDSDAAILGTVGSTYEPFQNLEAFQFLEPLTDDGELVIHSAGSVRGGRQVFMVAEVPGMMQNVMDDPHEMYAIIRTGHDGTKAVQVLLMGLRGLCMNMLALPSFSSHAQQRWSVPHTSTMKERLQIARGSMVSMERYDKEFASMAERLAEIEIEREEFEKLVANVLPDTSAREKIVAGIGSGFEHSPTIQDHFRNTGWGALSATTEYIDWGRSRSTDEGRFHSVMDGWSNRIGREVTSRLLARA